MGNIFDDLQDSKQKDELNDANKPAINKSEEANEEEFTSDFEEGESAPEPEVDPTKDPHLKEENKLPLANELEAEEENPEQRKIAGEAPYVTAARPDAFTKEVDGGVVKEEKPKREGVITGDRKSEDDKSSTTSTPVITP